MSDIIAEHIATLPAPEPLDFARACLLFDLDGTLAPFEPTPDAVGPDPRRSRLLVRLAERLDGRVAVISGRSIPEIDRITGAAVPAVAGVHGLERRTAAGQLVRVDPDPAIADARSSFDALALAQSGLLVEDKGLSVALHYRNAPEAAPAVVELARRLAASTGLVLQRGESVAELRTPGPNKGDAVAAFMAEPPFAGAMPIFIGDDLTDEDAFSAAQVLGGFGILVGAPRPTLASRSLADVDTVLGWFEKELDR